MRSEDLKRLSSEFSQERKRLKKRIKELTTSRDDWKAKSLYHKKRADNLSADIKKIKDKLNIVINVP